MAVDTTKAHLGRIYDFMLGGHHNYEVDRQAAAEILKVAPAYPKWARLNRWFLQFVASEWAQAGRKRVLDLATGLPTTGHFNDVMPDARILFSDNDPLSVAYGEQLLAGNPDMAYCLADVGRPETLTRAMDDFFGAERELAVACIGISYLVPDAVVAALFQALHAWCAPGSILAVSFGVWIGADRAQIDVALAAIRRHANTTMYMRTTEEFAALASPWRLTACRSLPDWLDVPDMFTPEEMQLRGAGMNGAFFEH